MLPISLTQKSITISDSWNGAWNDADGSSDTNAYCADPSSWDPPNDPDTASWCRFGQNGYFPLCQVQPAAAPAPGSLVQYVWGTGATSSFRIQICVDHIVSVSLSRRPLRLADQKRISPQDTIYFQDDRLWIAYGGQYRCDAASGGLYSGRW